MKRGQGGWAGGIAQRSTGVTFWDAAGGWTRARSGRGGSVGFGRDGQEGGGAVVWAPAQPGKHPGLGPALSPQMSGAIFAPLEGPGALDAASSHPLVCPLCHTQYERPCLLDCFHDFCAGCLRGRAIGGRLACPLCQ